MTDLDSTVDEPSPYDVTATPSPTADRPVDSPDRLKRSKAWIGWVAGIVLAAGAGVGAGYLLWGTDDSTTSSGPGAAPAQQEPLSDADTLVVEGLELHNAGDLVAADTRYRAALELDPGNRFALYNMGQIRQVQGNNTEAIEYYRRALDTDPSWHTARYNMAIALYAEGQVDTAIAEMRIIVNEDPNSTGALYNLGQWLIGQGEVEEGGQFLARAIELEPSLLAEVDTGG